MPVFVDELQDGNLRKRTSRMKKEVSNETLVSRFNGCSGGRAHPRVVGVDARRCSGPEGRGEGLESAPDGVWPAGPAGNMELLHAPPPRTPPLARGESRFNGGKSCRIRKGKPSKE